MKVNILGGSQLQPDPLIEKLFDQCKNNASQVFSRLVYCFEHGLLTDQQKTQLSNILWRNNEFQVPAGWLRTICLSLPAPQNIDTIQYMTNVLTKEVNGYIGKGTRTEHDINLLNEINAVALNRLDTFSPKQITAILLAFSERLKSLANNLLRNLPGMSELTKGLFYSTLHSMWLITSVRSTWSPDEADKHHMKEILEICEKTDTYHYGLQSYWGNILDDLNIRNEKLQAYICHPDKYRSEWGYRVLAIAIRRRDYCILTEKDICSGLTAIAQQIQWRASAQLSLALQVVDVAVTYQPQLLSQDIMWSIMTGISHLAQETKIEMSDTNETSASKLELRMYAARLIKNLNQKSYAEEYSNVIDLWIKIIFDGSEFAEIHNA